MRPTLAAYPLYLAMRGVSAFAFALIITYELALHAVVIGLSPLQLVLVGVVLESMTIIFEIPTGIFADLVSRRLSIILGLSLTGAGFMLESLLPSLTTVLLAQVIWGIGFTFYSGADTAWIVDEIGIDQAQPALLRATQIGFIATVGGTFCGALLASLSVTAPLILGAAIYLALAAGLLLVMPETGFQPAARDPEQRLEAHLLQPFRDNIRLVRVHPLLWLILLVGLYSGMVVGSMLFALAGVAMAAIVGFCLTQTLRNIGRPILLLWINQNAERQIRATVISSYWQANALGQVAGSPLIGWIGTAFSLRAALGVGTVLYTGTIPLLLLAQRRWRRVRQASSTPQ